MRITLTKHAGRTVVPLRGVALLGYLGLALLVLAPLLPYVTTAIPGGLIAATDGWQNVWKLWWVHQAVSAGRDPFVTDLLFYPYGAPLHLQTLGIVNALLALPITATWGPVAGYNAALLATLVLSGMAGYALALHVCRDRLAAFLSGAVFTCSPFHLTRIYDGQLELPALQWPAFYALFLLRAVERRKLIDALLAGTFLALTGLSSWYYLLLMALYSVVFTPLWLVGQGRQAREKQEDRPRAGTAFWPIVRQAALVALVGSLLLLPVALPAFATAQGRNGAVLGVEAEELRGRSANLLDPWLPSYLHPLWGDALFLAVSQAWQDYNGDWNVSLGYGVLALAGLGAATAWALVWRWLVLAAVALLFAFGPELQIGAWRTGVPLPYALLDAAPGLSLGRRPHLFMAGVTLALVPPVALGLRALRRLPGRGRLLLPAVLLALAFELTPAPWPLQHADAPEYARRLAAGEGAVLEVPPPRYKYVEPQRAQLVHGRPLFGGYLARPPRYPLPNETPALRALWQMRPDPDLAFAAGAVDPAALLFFYGVRDVVVHWERIRPDRHEHVAALLEQVLPNVEPSYADGATSIYRVPAVPAQPFVAPVGRGWHPIEGPDGEQWRWMTASGHLLLLNPTDNLMRIELKLRVQGYLHERPLTLSLAGYPLGTWEVGPATRWLELTLWLPPGEHRLTLAAPAEDEQVRHSSRSLSIALLQLRSEIKLLGRAMESP